MKPQFRQPRAASGLCVQISASVLGQTIMVVPPKAAFVSAITIAWILAPLVTRQAEIALEDAAWALGRIWAGGVALTNLYEGAVRHDRIVADDTIAVPSPRPRTPIIIVPHPDIRPPPLMLRRGAEPSEPKPRRKHHHGVTRPDASGPPLSKRRDMPIPHRKPDGDAP